MLIVGLTGGIGCGKSTVATIFSELGTPIIDADKIAKHLLENDNKILKTIRSHLGDSYFLASGKLDRPKLRQSVFDNPQQKIWLEKLLHPKIEEQLRKQIQQLKHPYCIIEIPLLIETLPHDYLDRILVIDTNDQDQIDRTVARDNVSPTHVTHIIAQQASREQRLAHADDVIINDDTMKTLQNKVRQLHNDYLQRAERNNYE